MNNEKTIYELTEEHFEQVEKFANKINRHKCGSINISIISKEIRNIAPADVPEYCLSFVKFTVLISNLELGNWELIAKKQFISGVVLVYQCSEESLDKSFWNDNFECEHCHTMRGRKNIFILKNVHTGELKQVGKSCLEDFCGMDVSSAIKYWNEFDKIISYIDKIREDEDSLYISQRSAMYSGFKDTRYIPLQKILAYCYMAIKEHGYISKSTVRLENSNLIATTDLALLMYKDKLKITEEVTKFVEDTIIYFLNLDLSDKDAFLLNSQELLKLEYIPISKIGYIAFIPNSYIHYLEREKEKEVKKKLEGKIISEYIGTVGDKIKDLEVTYLGVHSYDSEFGVMGFFKFKDEKGRILIWKTSMSSKHSKDIEEYQKVFISGTIKELSEFRDMKQTYVTRCKIK